MEIIKRIYAFRRENPAFAHVPIIFMPENNQGELPKLLKKELLYNFHPSLCGWLFYCERPKGEGGFDTTEHTKFGACGVLNCYFKEGKIRFFFKIAEEIIERVITEFRNEQQRVDRTARNSVPEFYAPQGCFDDAISCFSMFTIGSYRFLNEEHVTLNTLRCVSDRLHQDCEKHATGHNELLLTTRSIFDDLS